LQTFSVKERVFNRPLPALAGLAGHFPWNTQLLREECDCLRRNGYCLSAEVCGYIFAADDILVNQREKNKSL
jgi:hypothetical protein